MRINRRIAHSHAICSSTPGGRSRPLPLIVLLVACENDKVVIVFVEMGSEDLADRAAAFDNVAKLSNFSAFEEFTRCLA